MKNVIALLLFASTAHAATLSLSPAVINLKGTFGQSTTQRLTMTNATTDAMSFDLAAEDVVVGNGKRLFVPAGEIAGSIAATAVFSRQRVAVRPGESASVDVTLTVPQNAAPRGVVALFRGTTKILNRGVLMTPSLGTLITFAMSDDVDVNASPLALTPPSASRNLTIADRVVNSGSEPLVVRAVAAIVDARGAMVGRIDLRPHRLFPREAANIEGAYAGDVAPGHYRVLLTCDLGGKTITRSAELDVR